MSLSITRTRSYERDLAAIWRYLEEHSEQAADRMICRIESRVDLLAGFPESGERQPRFGPNCRRVIEGNYLVFYDAYEDRVEVLRVLHGARRIERLGE